MYTYDQVLWYRTSNKGRTIEYKVIDTGRVWLYGTRVDNLGRLASRYRKQGERVFKALPELPTEIMDSILAIAQYQDTWLERQAAKAAEEVVDERYANVGRFED